MKILVLNPQLNAMQQVSHFLEKKGIYALCVGQSNEVLPILQLQEKQIDLLVLHREGAQGEGDPGVHLMGQLIQNPEWSQLPIILTTSSWSMQQCAVHQQASGGAHAYLSYPFEPADLWQTIQTIFELDSIGEHEGQPHQESTSNAQVSIQKGASEKSLEDVSLVFTRSELAPDSESSIQFDQPQIQLDSSSSQEVSLSIPPEGLSSGRTQTPTSSQGSTASIPTLVSRESSNEMSSSTQRVESSPELTQGIQGSEGQLDPQAAQEMPYLFRKRSLDLSFVEPTGDAIVPGGVAHSPDLETFKHYLLLREQDVAILSAQLKSAQEQIEVGAKTFSEERAQNSELLHLCQEQKKKLTELEEKHLQALESREKFIQDLQFQLRVKADEVRHLEHETQKAIDETDQLKERVRIDIRKIRTREKELENRLEIMKKDSEAMMSTRETTIIELKRQLDLLEFNMDLVQVQFAREKEVSAQLRERLAKASQAVRLVGGLLETPGKSVGESASPLHASERKEKVS